MKVSSSVYLRPLQIEDKQEFINLKLKQGDIDEVQKMVSASMKEYLKWHFDSNRNITQVFIKEGKIIGFIGISEDGMLFFLTKKLDRLLKYTIVRRFKEVLETIMEDRGFTEVRVWMDAEYTKAKDWAIHGGFTEEQSGTINNNPFKVLRYNRQIVAN